MLTCGALLTGCHCQSYRKENNIKREQVIKVLECCSKGDCKRCPLGKLQLECIKVLPINTLFLIRELTTDVERVSKQCAEIIIECDERDAERLRQVGEYSAKVKELTEENECLNADLDGWLTIVEGFQQMFEYSYERHQEELAQTRREVIREIFAELETSYPDEYFTGGIEITQQELNELKQKYEVE